LLLFFNQVSAESDGHMQTFISPAVKIILIGANLLAGAFHPKKATVHIKNIIIPAICIILLQ